MATQTYEQLIAGANKIKENELPESNTHDIVGEQLLQMTNKMQEENSNNGKKFSELEQIIGKLEFKELVDTTQLVSQYGYIDKTGIFNEISETTGFKVLELSLKKDDCIIVRTVLGVQSANAIYESNKAIGTKIYKSDDIIDNRGYHTIFSYNNRDIDKTVLINYNIKYPYCIYRFNKEANDSLLDISNKMKGIDNTISNRLSETCEFICKDIDLNGNIQNVESYENGLLRNDGTLNTDVSEYRVYTVTNNTTRFLYVKAYHNGRAFVDIYSTFMILNEKGNIVLNGRLQGVQIIALPANYSVKICQGICYGVQYSDKVESTFANINDVVDQIYNNIDLKNPYTADDFIIKNYFNEQDFVASENPVATIDFNNKTLQGGTANVINQFSDLLFFAAYSEKVTLSSLTISASKIYHCPIVLYDEFHNVIYSSAYNIIDKSGVGVLFNHITNSGSRYSSTAGFFVEDIMADVNNYLDTVEQSQIKSITYEKVYEKLKITYNLTDDSSHVLGLYTLTFKFDLVFATFAYSSKGEIGDTISFESYSYEDFTIRAPKKIEKSIIDINKDFYALGDSTTNGAGSGGTSTSGTYSWSDRLKDKLKFKSYHKLAVNGTTCMLHNSTTGFPDTRSALMNQINQIPEYNNGIITVMIGTNDMDLEHGLGNFEEVMNKDYNSLQDGVSFAESFRLCMETLIRRCPMATVLFMAPISPFSSSYDNYVNVERNICNVLSIPIIETQKEAGINKYCNYIVGVTDDLISPTGLMADRLHPNNAGYEKIANYMKQYFMRFIDLSKL